MPGPTRLAPIVLALVLAAAAASAAGAPAGARTDGSRLLTATFAPQAAHTTLTDAARARLEAAAVWGGPVTTSTGETFTLYLSDSYPQDDARRQRWAEFFASLVHGPELSRLTAYLLPLREVQSYCGRQALACYAPNRSLLVTPAENPYPDISAEGIAAHEYGHHVATYRNNAPWRAVDYGTKRWASYQQVCARAARGELHPGAENSAQYRLNPGEAFAEAFRVLNERRLGLVESPWQIVTSTLHPDATALALVEQDVVQPWQEPATATFTGRAGRGYSIATPLDGTMQLNVRAVGRKTRVRLEVTVAGRRIANRLTGTAGSATMNTTVCGARSAQVRVTRTAGAGTYALTVTKP